MRGWGFTARQRCIIVEALRGVKNRPFLYYNISFSFFLLQILDSSPAALPPTRNNGRCFSIYGACLNYRFLLPPSHPFRLFPQASGVLRPPRPSAAFQAGDEPHPSRRHCKLCHPGANPRPALPAGAGPGDEPPHRPSGLGPCLPGEQRPKILRPSKLVRLQHGRFRHALPPGVFGGRRGGGRLHL